MFSITCRQLIRSGLNFFNSFGSKAFSKAQIDSKLSGMNASLDSRILLAPYLPLSGGNGKLGKAQTFL